MPRCLNVSGNSKAIKSYQIAPVWRADKPQRGRFREFYQCDIDIIGTTSVLADAELMVVIHAVLTQLGIKDFIIHINNRKLLNAIASIAGIPNAELAAFLRSLENWIRSGRMA